MHKYKGQYYFSYSTGDTHKIVYATGNNPYGPFTYQGVILDPVLGWTNVSAQQTPSCKSIFHGNKISISSTVAAAGSFVKTCRR